MYKVCIKFYQGFGTTCLDNDPLRLQFSLWSEYGKIKL